MDSAIRNAKTSRWVLGGVVAVLAGASQGCYHYASVPVADLSPGVAVRMELSAVAVDRLRRGPDSVSKLLDGFNVNGTVSRVAGDSVRLNYRVVRYRTRTGTT